MDTAFRLRVSATEQVSGLYRDVADASATLILAHGAGAPMTHQHMQSIADALAAVGIATLRFNFPYMEAGRNRTDAVPVCVACFRAAVDDARTRAARPVFVGGHSFGGRMSSHFLSESGSDARGAIYFSFPLHMPDKPGVTRAAHMGEITVPQLFLSGTRDAMAQPALLEQVVGGLPDARIHWLDSADHSFKVLKRSRTVAEDVYSEAARVAAAFVRDAL